MTIGPLKLIAGPNRCYVRKHELVLFWTGSCVHELFAIRGKPSYETVLTEMCSILEERGAWKVLLVAYIPSAAAAVEEPEGAARFHLVSLHSGSHRTKGPLLFLAPLLRRAATSRSLAPFTRGAISARGSVEMMR
ncbi:Hypothetical predicted protein [Cloeon dipterum]|uniref:Uncharacterized protein n=1 Tax=Cloeon dipterum TaxID=197152 RepID=A0A8S1CUS2_9INSE|nr:Hypothetical predicted protein [Cloeon dipterum]